MQKDSQCPDIALLQSLLRSMLKEDFFKNMYLIESKAFLVQNERILAFQCSLFFDGSFSITLLLHVREMACQSKHFPFEVWLSVGGACFFFCTATVSVMLSVNTFSVLLLSACSVNTTG